MSAAALLNLLQGVRQTGRGSWIAKCPAHADRSPSFTIRETDDGRVLFHCFGGCSFDDVVKATGVDISELFPPEPIGNKPRERQRFPAHDILRAIATEAMIAAIAASDMAKGKTLSEESRRRLVVAADRLQSAAEVANGR